MHEKKHCSQTAPPCIQIGIKTHMQRMHTDIDHEVITLMTSLDNINHEVINLMTSLYIQVGGGKWVWTCHGLGLLD